MSTDEKRELIERLAVIETKQDAANVTLLEIKVGLWKELEPRVQSLERWRSYLVGAWAVVALILIPVAIAIINK